MKVTKNQLKQLISEEIKNVLSENRYGMPGMEREMDMYGDYLRRQREKEQEKRKAAQQKTPAPDDSTDKADDDQTKKMVSVDKKEVDEIRATATELERALIALEKEGKIDSELKLKKKATDIIDFVNTRL